MESTYRNKGGRPALCDDISIYTFIDIYRYVFVKKYFHFRFLHQYSEIWWGKLNKSGKDVGSALRIEGF
jgi:hypothetical protein